MSLRCACGEQAVYASCELLLLVYDLRLLCMVGDAPAVCLCMRRGAAVCAYVLTTRVFVLRLLYIIHG